MKKLIGSFLIGLFTICSACDREDEVPPRLQGIRQEYQLPKARPLTETERDICRQMREEYTEAIKGL